MWKKILNFYLIRSSKISLCSIWLIIKANTMKHLEEDRGKYPQDLKKEKMFTPGKGKVQKPGFPVLRLLVTDFVADSPSKWSFVEANGKVGLRGSTTKTPKFSGRWNLRLESVARCVRAHGKRSRVQAKNLIATYFLKTASDRNR